MVAYCKHDVRLLEQVWERLAPYLPVKTHRAAHVSLSACPECSSQNTIVSKHKTTAAGHRKVQYQCKDCGKYHSIAASRYDKAKAEAERAA
jgi:transposase-like protein